MDVMEDGESAIDINRVLKAEKTKKSPCSLSIGDSKDKDQDTDTEEKNN